MLDSAGCWLWDLSVKTVDYCIPLTLANRYNTLKVSSYFLDYTYRKH